MGLGVNFNLPPAEALAFFRAKGLRGSFAWQDLRDNEHDRDFTVAKMLDMDLLSDVYQAVDTALASGQTFEQFKQNLKPLLVAKGWWGEQEVTDPLTGETVLAQLGSSRRLRTIFDVNLSTAYAAGHWQGILANAEFAPYLMYNAVDDDRTRPLHRSWDNLILRWDDAWWETHFPPNGWNCRCTVIQLNDADLVNMGKTGPDASPTIQHREWVNPRTGEVEQVPVGIDPGWNYHPGLDRGEQLARTFINKAGAAPAALGAAAFEQVSTRILAGLEAEFAAWVDLVFAAGQAEGSASVVGVLSSEDLAYLATQGIEPVNAGIVVEDRLLVGKKAERHSESGNALTVDEWKNLPAALAVPESVLWDVKNETLLYIFPVSDSQSGKLAVAVNYTVKKQGIVNSARTAFKVTQQNLTDHIKVGEYIVVR